MLQSLIAESKELNLERMTCRSMCPAKLSRGRTN